jgi:hypothetical protein
MKCVYLCNCSQRGLLIYMFVLSCVRVIVNYCVTQTLLKLAGCTVTLIVPHEGQRCGARRPKQLMAKIRVRAPGSPSSAYFYLILRPRGLSLTKECQLDYNPLIHSFISPLNVLSSRFLQQLLGAVGISQRVGGGVSKKRCWISPL